MAAREALHAATTSPSFDEGLVRAKAAELAAVEADLAVSRARIFADVFQILTPEQQAKAKELSALATAPTERTAVTMWSRGDPEAVEQFFGLAASGDLADGHPMDADAGLPHRFGDGVADSAGRVVILDRDDLPAGRVAGGNQAASCRSAAANTDRSRGSPCPPAFNWS